MNNIATIVTLSDNRVKEAECLFNNNHYDYAYYTAGYAVELILKAKICKLLDIENFFDFGNRTKFTNEDKITNPYKVHNFEQLLLLAGLYNNHNTALKDVDFKSDWSILNKWEEGTRYKIKFSKEDSAEFIEAVKRFKLWILKFL